MGLDIPIHLLFLLVLLLLVFGAKRLPEMGRSLGSGMRGFKDSLNGVGMQGIEPPQPVHAVQTVPADNQEQPVAAGGLEQRR
jgi:sec-independent protein translocase protein TatA